MLHRRLAAATVALKAGRAYTVAAFGQLTSGRAMRLDDDMSRPASGKSKVRFIQALPGDQAVDLASDGGVLLSGARFPSPSGYLEVPAGQAAPAGGMATGAGGTAPTGGHRFAVLVLLGAGIAAAVGFVVQQRRSTG